MTSYQHHKKRMLEDPVYAEEHRRKDREKKRNDRLDPVIRSKQIERQKASYHKHKEKNKEKNSLRAKKYREENRDHVRDMARKSYKKVSQDPQNRAHRNALARIRRRKYMQDPIKHQKKMDYQKRSRIKYKIDRRDVDNLSDKYIKKCISQQNDIPMKDVPLSLIPIKRKQLKLIRYVKDQKNQSKKPS